MLIWSVIAAIVISPRPLEPGLTGGTRQRPRSTTPIDDLDPHPTGLLVE
jgi:hypothetical protein